MSSSLKTFTTSCLLLVFAVLIFWAYLEDKNQTPSVSASALVCEGPVMPVGSALEDTLDLMDQVFQIYQAQVGNLNLAIQNIQGITAALSENPEVCDFSVCSPIVENKGPEITFTLDAFVKQWTLSGRLPPWCAPKECAGNPCADLTPYVRGKAGSQGFVGLATLQKTFEVSADMIDDLFSKEIFPITEEYKTQKDKETGKTKLTWLEKIDREKTLAGLLAQPWPGVGVPTCVMNVDQKELVERGELEPWDYQECADALEQGKYQPKAISPDCQKECQGDFDEDCYNCLKKPENCAAEKRQKSWYADVNCQIFNTCQDECQDGYWSAKCFECLGDQPKLKEQDDPEQALLDWLCGGSSLNFVCCQ